MEKKVEEIKKLFTDLFVIVQRYGGNSFNPSKEILKEILSILEGGDAPADKLSKVKFWYGSYSDAIKFPLKNPSSGDKNLSVLCSFLKSSG